VFINQEKSCAYTLLLQQIQQWRSDLRIRTIVKCQVNRLLATVRYTPNRNLIVRQIEKKRERSGMGERRDTGSDQNNDKDH
jgi:hypothetical protein